MELVCAYERENASENGHKCEHGDKARNSKPVVNRPLVVLSKGGKKGGHTQMHEWYPIRLSSAP